MITTSCLKKRSDVLSDMLKRACEMERVKKMPAKSICGKCGKTFISLEAFDAHRTGSFQRKTRRCLMAQEMCAAGMAQNSKGWWYFPAKSKCECQKTWCLNTGFCCAAWGITMSCRVRCFLTKIITLLPNVLSVCSGLSS